jgi:hypothetical protein
MRKRRYTKQKRLERVSIRAERRTEPDWDRFAWALLQYVRLLNQQAPDKPSSNKD